MSLPFFITITVVVDLPAIMTLPAPMYIPFPEGLSFASLRISAIVAVLGMSRMTETSASVIGLPSALLTMTSNWLSPVFAAVGCINMMSGPAVFVLAFGFACAGAEDAATRLNAATIN